MATDPHAAGGVLIDAAGLAKRYGRAGPVLSDVTFRVMPGERVALIGANGAGKSTLLKGLIGLVPLDAGEVSVLGERFSREPQAAQRRRLRRQTGFVFQRHGLVGRLSVLSNVCHGLLGGSGSWRGFAQGIAPGDWRVRAMAALGQVGLADRAGERADRLSGGQSQRVAIARALVRAPRLIIADEPAASLDPAAGEDVMGLFSDLARRGGITLLFTSHDMGHALAFTDRVIALRGGRIVIDRPTASLGPADLAPVFNG